MRHCASEILFVWNRAERFAEQLEISRYQPFQFGLLLRRRGVVGKRFETFTGDFFEVGVGEFRIEIRIHVRRSQTGGEADWERRLDVVANGEFERKSALGFEERMLFFALSRAARSENCRRARKLLSVHAQIAIRQLVEPKGKAVGTGPALNGLTVDFVVLEDGCDPCVVFEHHGSGHFGDDAGAYDRIAAHDLIKEEVLRSAGIPLIMTKSADRKRFGEIASVGVVGTSANAPIVV